MTHLSAIFGMTGSSDTIRFGSLEFPTLPPVGMWVPPVFEPFQTFLFESLDFVADQLGVLCLREEALVPAPVGGGAPSVGSGPPDDLNDETPAFRSEPTLGSNPTVSNVHTVLYSLFIFSADSPEGPRCSCHDRQATGSPTASRPPQTCTRGGSERC